MRPSLDPTSKAQRTREKIKAATRLVLERIGFRAMKVADVAEEAGVAVGLFYHYFPDLKTVTCEVLSDFIQTIETEIRALPHQDDRFDAIFHPTLLWTTAYEANPGLMRCLLQVADEVPEFRQVWVRGNLRHARRVAGALLRQFPDPSVTDDFALSFAFSLGAMVDGLVHEIYVQRNPDLRALLPQPRDVAELLSAIWYRALYLQNPPLEKLTIALPLLAISDVSARPQAQRIGGDGRS
jgi:AcrR family transcriptional regulator